MTLDKIKESLKTDSYNFLRDDPSLGGNIILLGLGGSHAYGTENENSDIDIRGIATNTKKYILSGRDFEQVVERDTDTVVYSFDKIINLLCSCNPNTIEILGLKPEHYLYMSPVGKLLYDNRELFLSKVAAHSFGGYANAQLRRLENKAARLTTQTQQEANVLKSIQHASVDFRLKYFGYPDDAIRLYLDRSDREELDSEIFMDLNLSHYPLRDYKCMWHEMQAIVKSYEKIGGRNSKAIEHNKLGKHMMHLIRLYLMCFDILERGEINTYREKEHDFLMRIRNGAFLDRNRQPVSAFYDIVNEYERKLDYDIKYTELPDKPDMDAIYDLKATINGVVCK